MVSNPRITDWSNADKRLSKLLQDFFKKCELYHLDKGHFITAICNSLALLYQKLSPFFSLLGLVAWFLLFVFGICKNEHIAIREWLIASGILASIVILTGGMTYNDITAYDSFKPYYFAGAYPLLISFTIISLSSFVNLLPWQHKKNEK